MFLLNFQNPPSTIPRAYITLSEERRPACLRDARSRALAGVQLSSDLCDFGPDDPEAHKVSRFASILEYSIRCANTSLRSRVSLSPSLPPLSQWISTHNTPSQRSPTSQIEFVSHAGYCDRPVRGVVYHATIPLATLTTSAPHLKLLSLDKLHTLEYPEMAAGLANLVHSIPTLWGCYEFLCTRACTSSFLFGLRIKAL